jgi:dTDP-4-amino-4,6-dideoxygalactose transaminase
MIPRRRIALARTDLADLVRSLWVADQQADTEIAAFEREFSAAIGVRHAIATASGRDALLLILDGLGIGAGDELIVPAYTLGELVPLIRAAGIVPVPADVDVASFNVTPENVAARIGRRTRGILALHAFGAPCDVIALRALADRHRLALVEDCAHAPGATINGRPAGSFGDAALFSLEATKAVASFGGGVATTDDAVLAARLRTALKKRQRREWPAMKKALLKMIEEIAVRSPLYALAARLLFAPQRAGGFDRLYRQAHGRLRVAHGFSAFQARLGRRRLAQLPARNVRLAALWQTTAAAIEAGSGGRIKAQQRDAHGQPAFYNLVVRLTDGGDVVALRARLQRMGIDAGIGSEVMDDIAPVLGFADCPGAARLVRETLLLPLYDGLSPHRQAVLLDALQKLADNR